jgi:nicotinamide-nucleotide amidase
VTIGTELLLGQITDTNTAYLAQELAGQGISVRYRTAVGDQLGEIQAVIGDAVNRCDLVITTGGVGPTLDDLTREAVAEVAGVPLEFRQELMDQIEEIFRRAGYRMPENNRRQAYVPRGSQPIANPVGTAPAFITEVDGTPIVCLPGVPRELHFLLKREVLPRLRERFHLAGQGFTYRVLKAAGIGESKVDGIIGDLIRAGQNPEVGLMASLGEIKIRIAGRAGSREEALALIQPVENEICSRLGTKIFGRDDETLEGVVDALLGRGDWKLAILDTFSGGRAAERLHRLPSACVVESRVIPDRERLSRWLGRRSTGSVSEEHAGMLAEHLRQESLAHVALAIVGFPEKRAGAYAVKGCAAAVGPGLEKLFSWEAGGDMRTLSQRTAVIGLNTLRLALLDALGVKEASEG